MPPDIHPLPLDVTPYFVYPFTLEQHVLTLESSRRSTLASHTAKRDAILRAREEEKQRRRRDALRKVAPGFEPEAGTLVPTKKVDRPSPPALQKDVMSDLVDQLAALDSGKSR